jgi:hypothetical protein
MSVTFRCAASKSSGSVFKSAITSVQKTFTSIFNNKPCLSIIASPPQPVYSSVQKCLPITVNNHFRETHPSLPNHTALAEDNTLDSPFDLSMWFISTLKRRKKKMNKHKLSKRRKLLRAKTKK